MAVSLSPRYNLRKNLKRYYQKLDASQLAASMGINPNLLYDCVTLKTIPAPDVFMAMLKALEVEDVDIQKSMSFWYVQVLARRTRTSSIPVHRFPQTSLPDPYDANSVEELVHQLNDVRQWALGPSLRQLEISSGFELKRATISDMLNPKKPRLPRPDRYLAFLTACGVADTAPWVHAYRRISNQQGRKGTITAA